MKFPFRIVGHHFKDVLMCNFMLFESTLRVLCRHDFNDKHLRVTSTSQSIASSNLSVCLSVLLPTYLPTCLFIYLPTYPPTYLPTYLSICRSIYLPTHPSDIRHDGSFGLSACGIFVASKGKVWLASTRHNSHFCLPGLKRLWHFSSFEIEHFWLQLHPGCSWRLIRFCHFTKQLQIAAQSSYTKKLNSENLLSCILLSLTLKLWFSNTHFKYHAHKILKAIFFL